MVLKDSITKCKDRVNTKSKGQKRAPAAAKNKSVLISTYQTHESGVAHTFSLAFMKKFKFCTKIRYRNLKGKKEAGYYDLIISTKSFHME